MPLYQYMCSKCLKKVDVLRTFAEWEVPPTSEEGEGLCITPAPDTLPAESTDTTLPAAPDTPHHQWQRHISSAATILKGPSWQGSKGNW